MGAATQSLRRTADTGIGRFILGNLGGYQRAVELMKQFGGPGKALTLGIAVVGTAGYGVLRLVEHGSKKTIAAVKTARACEKVTMVSEPVIYRVHTTAVDKQGLAFNVGDLFSAGESVDDAVLIEIINNDNNPWAVSPLFLAQISDYAPDVDGEGLADSSAD